MISVENNISLAFETKYQSTDSDALRLKSRALPSFETLKFNIGNGFVHH
jgi:hypothetical protein